MKATLIGSNAIKHWFPDFNRTPSDFDYAIGHDKVKSETLESGMKIEYLYNPVFDKFENEVATPEQLLALKVSHLFWDTNWNKHMWDAQFLLGKGVDFDYKLYKEFRNFFEDYLPKIRRSELEQSKEQFFTNAVNEDVDEHDKLHHILAEVPAYTKILKDGCDVEVDFDKFEALSFDEKMDVVIEEICVMVTERYSGKLPWYTAFHVQLTQNIMKHFPEPIALFSIFNYKKLLNLRKLKIEEYFKKLSYEKM